MINAIYLSYDYIEFKLSKYTNEGSHTRYSFYIIESIQIESDLIYYLADRRNLSIISFR